MKFQYEVLKRQKLHSHDSQKSFQYHVKKIPKFCHYTFNIHIFRSLLLLICYCTFHKKVNKTSLNYITVEYP